MLRRFLAVLLCLTTMAPAVVALPLPGVNGSTTEQLAAPVGGRLFPEPLETNDYIGYFEALPSFEKLAKDYPDRIEMFRVAKSFGWLNRVTGAVDHNDVLLFEVTNEKSPIPLDQKIQLVFTCSVHGNEKGGREGCMRVIEDFAKGIGIAAEKPELVSWLDYMVLVFGFTNTDGWAHDEPEYFTGSPSTMYVRENANGSDLNRQWPTLGFIETDQSHKTMAEPEVAGMASFMRERYKNVWYAIDIHGMLNPADGTPGAPVQPGPDAATDFQDWLQNGENGHFVLGLLTSQELSQDELFRQTRMAELIRERINGCPGRLGATYCTAPATGAWGGEYNFWGTSWETIGYTSTGTTSMFMGNPYGLNAPAASYEMAYNHMVCDSEYIGCGAYMNEFHVNNVRQMVRALMEAASTDFHVSLEANGMRTAYVYNPKIVTTAGPDGNPRPSTGWSDENERDDQWDILHNVFVASPMEYFRDLAKYVRSGDQPGVFDELPVDRLEADLARYNQLVVAGSTIEVLGEPHKAAIKKWVEDGGRLILTDQSMQLLETMGLVAAGSVKGQNAYVGRTEVVDRTHPIAQNLLGYSRQTYDPCTIGYAQDGAPVWTIALAEAQKGKVVGILPNEGAAGVAGSGGDANLGEMPLGKGMVRYIGALLPDPSLELYTPYGVGGHGVTYAGNQYFHNLAGLSEVFEAPPLVFESDGALVKPAQGQAAADNETAGTGMAVPVETEGTPSVGFAGLVVAIVVGVVAVACRRRE